MNLRATYLRLACARPQVDGFESHDGTMGAAVRGDPNELLNADLNLNSAHAGWLTANIPNE